MHMLTHIFKGIIIVIILLACVNILNIPIDAAIRRSVEKANELKIQLIEVTSGTKGFEFDLNTTQRLDLFSDGYNAAKEQYLK